MSLRTLMKTGMPFLEGLRSRQPSLEKQFESIILDHLQPHHLVLDAGCGITTYAAVKGKCRMVIGVDADTSVTRNRHIDGLIHGDLYRLPFPDNTFDIVMSWTVLEHIGNPQACFQELARVCKPGGLMVHATPNALHYANFIIKNTPYNFHKWFISHIMGTQDFPYPTCYKVNTPGSFRKTARENGFTPAEIRMLDPGPVYLHWASPAYALGLVYHRLVNSAGIFAPWRSFMIGTAVRQSSGLKSKTPGRITVLFPITDLGRDGAQRQLFELVKGLDKERFHPVVLTLNSGGAMEKDFLGLPGVTVTSVDKRGKFDLLCLLRVYRQIRRWKPSIIQPFLTPATFFGLLPAIWSRVPVIIITERNSGGRTDMGVGARLYLKIEDLFSRFADRAIPNSEAGKLALIQRGIKAERIRTIYNGLNFQRLQTDKVQVQLARQKYHIPPHIPVVGMMARFSAQKNHTDFFETAALINRMRPDVHFALLGDGPRRTEMEALCKDLGLKQQTTFFGEHADVGTYLSIFDVMLLTSDAEGCSNSILEAMSLGKPVVATDVGGNREIIIPGETGILVPKGDIKTAADRVIELLHRNEKAREMGNRAREIILSRFNLDKMVKEYTTLFETTLEQKARPGRGEPVSYER